MTSILSPLAHSFDCSNTYDKTRQFNDCENLSFSVIYNDGAPCLVMRVNRSAISGNIFDYSNTCAETRQFNDYARFSFSVIYNDGAPCLVMCGNRSAISGISDEDYFPSTAEEVAELAIVDNYTELLATLDVLEKNARKLGNFKKRWEVRRIEDPFTVRQDKNSRYPGYGNHESFHHSASPEDDELIRHGFHPKLRNSTASWHKLPRNSLKKNKVLFSKHFRQNIKLIQQPRKQN